MVLKYDFIKYPDMRIVIKYNVEFATLAIHFKHGIAINAVFTDNIIKGHHRSFTKASFILLTY